MRSFTYTGLPGRVVFGAGASRERLAAEVEALGVQRLLVMATAPELALADELAAPLADRVVGRFTGVRPHVPADVAERAREAARAARADGLLSVGGGSTTGAAKAVALQTGAPIVAVPTTYAGSEMTPVWGVTEANRKTTGTDWRVLPKLVLYDPELTVSLPAQVTAASAMNAMAHCVEAFYAPGANPISTLIAEEGIRALARGIEGAVRHPDDLEARTETLYGAYLAGAAFAVAGSGLHHKICHALGGAYDLPHAELHTVILPHAVAFNTPALPEVMDRVATALDAAEAAGGLFDLAQRIGAPTALRDIGLRPDDLDDAVELVLAKIPHDNPQPTDPAAIRTLLEDALLGRRPASEALGAVHAR